METVIDLNTRPLASLLVVCASVCPLVSGSPTFEFAEDRIIVASDPADGDEFGLSVAISNETALVGSTLDDHSGAIDAGSAYLFDWATGDELWKLTASDAAEGDGFGLAVGIDGGLAVVTSVADDVDGVIDAGSAYVFDVLTGQEVRQLLPTDRAADDQFGMSVAFNGDAIAIGSRRTDGTGALYLFDRTTGQQTMKLSPSDGNGPCGTVSEFGFSVAMSDSLIVVGAPVQCSRTGAVYVFDRTTGVELAKLVPPPNAGSQPRFGTSVAVSDSAIYVGARTADHSGLSNPGTVYAFDAKTRLQNRVLRPFDPIAEDNFGRSLSLSGDYLVVGSVGSRSAFVYGISCDQLVTRLVGSNVPGGGAFGYGVAIDGDAIIVGARRAPSGTVPDAGAAYTYRASVVDACRPLPPEPPVYSGGEFRVVGQSEGPGIPFDSSNTSLNLNSTTEGAEMSGGGKTGSGPIGSSLFVDFNSTMDSDGTITISLSTSTNTTNPCVNPDYSTATSISCLDPIRIDVDAGYSIEVVSGSLSGSGLDVFGLSGSRIDSPTEISLCMNFSSSFGSDPGFVVRLVPDVPSESPSPPPSGRRPFSNEGPFVITNAGCFGGSATATPASGSSDQESGCQNAAIGTRSTTISASSEQITVTMQPRLSILENAQDGTYEIIVEFQGDFSQSCSFDADIARALFFGGPDFRLNEPFELRVFETVGDRDPVELSVLPSEGSGISSRSILIRQNFVNQPLDSIFEGDYDISWSWSHGFDLAEVFDSMSISWRFVFIPIAGYDPCPLLEWDADGELTFFDFLAFLRSVEFTSSLADINADGLTDMDDVQVYLDRFESSSCTD